MHDQALIRGGPKAPAEVAVILTSDVRGDPGVDVCNW